MRSCATATVLLFVLLADAEAAQVSPVQKIIEMLDACKAKTQKDLDAESKDMEKYTQFCDDTVNDKTYAIDTAASQLEDLSATIEDSTATIASKTDEIELLGTTISDKQQELDSAVSARDAEHKTFLAAEKEVLASIDSITRGIAALKKGQASLLQGQGKAKLKAATAALAAIVNAESIDAASTAKLKSFIDKQQATSVSGEQDDDQDDQQVALTQQMMGQPQAKVVAFESQGGGIIETMEQMLEKAEATLGELRTTETENKHSFLRLQQSLKNEVQHTQEKLATATQDKAAATQTLEDANSKKTATEKSKAADEEYRSTLKTECQTKAVEWEARLRSANGEIAAIEKAKEILRTGVKVLMQVASSRHRISSYESYESGDSNPTQSLRRRLAEHIQTLGQAHRSFALNQLAVSALNDPFGKVRGLIEKMMSKLMKEAEESATKEAFCQESMAKSAKSHAEKTAEMEKHQTRMDEVGTTIAQLTEAVSTLEAELASTAKEQAEATALRREEHELYVKASSDYRASAEAVANAVEVLKSYYESSFLQVASNRRTIVTARRQQAPSFGGSQEPSGILGILEIAQEDFTNELAEIEATESEAQKNYDKMTQENEIAKATKNAESKGKATEVKSLKVQLEHSTEDYESVSKELDSVNAYISELKPKCETKVPSYEERKAAREAEIAGLHEAMDILGGEGLALLQRGNFRSTKKFLG